jgi:hypothetical protein
MRRVPVRRLMTRMAAERADAGIAGAVRIQHVMGLRAEESPARRRQAEWLQVPESKKVSRANGRPSQIRCVSGLADEAPGPGSAQA